MQKSSSLSRRDFLKISGIGLFSFTTYALSDFPQLNSGLQGRVIYDKVTLYDIPSFNGQSIKVYWKDSVIPISFVTIGDEVPEYNRVWYRVGEDGFAHSGGIQPVYTILNQPQARIPDGGILAEVTVPYTDAYWKPDKGSSVAYRFYFETTHWVVNLTQDSLGESWYRVLDDKWELLFYVQARHLRLIPASELSTLSPGIPPKAKRIEVRTADQVVIAYEWDRPVYVARAATGAQFSNGKFFTPPGRHKTFHKRPSRHMAAGNLAYNGYDLPGVPWICYITRSGVAFHGTYWHNDYGRPRSHGCINMTPKAAKWFYRWTMPAVPHGEQQVYEDYGTIVDVY